MIWLFSIIFILADDSYKNKIQFLGSIHVNDLALFVKVVD
jgi:hypothetical protein